MKRKRKVEIDGMALAFVFFLCPEFRKQMNDLADIVQEQMKKCTSTDTSTAKS